ncbi:MAG: ribosome maturation factor RimP [Actinomycetota bacterium]|nr:ribosome maturation factor RimP [Actinomycetota bacterium]
MVASASVLLEAIRSALAETGVDVEGVHVQQAGRREIVRVIVDRDGGVDLDRVAEVSCKISEILDSPPLADQFAGTFVLEVSSPGVDRPLTEPKHWQRALKRNVEVHLNDKSMLYGRILEVTDTGVVLQTSAVDPVSIALSDITRGLVQVAFTSTADESDAG